MTVEVGWIFYDARCRACRLGRRWTGRLFESRGFRWVPLQQLADRWISKYAQPFTRAMVDLQFDLEHQTA